ncbi:universal stress protein [Streptomyces sp. SBST2-5]|uniref:Universal stress protein n=1 Tax=Streptomyces composti TaxID=2720025 RepID=A0ABX1AE39_9ACTN|nr:universal stress protein [Streptomyces composti]NJP52034.1 universal stress protein [Streptomyces composti]
MISEPVVTAVDGSEDSLRALDWAIDETRRRRASLKVVHVRQYPLWSPPEVLAAAPPQEPGSPVLYRIRERLDGREGLPPVEYAALDGAPGAVVADLGASAQLLVLGSRGRGGFASLLLGSTSLAVARDADCPVVVVPRPGRQVHDGYRAGPGPRVVAGLNTDSPDEATLAFAFAEAAMRDARLEIVAAYPWPLQTWMLPGEMPGPAVDQDAVEHETLTLAEGFLAPHRKARPEVTAEIRALPGDAAGHLVAASRDAELVVVGRHRRRLLAPARMMGSVTQAVLSHAACPVAVIPPVPPEE